MFCFVYERSETLCSYWQCLIDCKTPKKITGSRIRFCNLASSIEITYMPVTIELRRLGKHIIYHIILQEVRKQFLAAAVQIHDVINKNEHFHLQSTPLRQRLDRGQGVKSNYLKNVFLSRRPLFENCKCGERFIRPCLFAFASCRHQNLNMAVK